MGLSAVNRTLIEELYGSYITGDLEAMMRPFSEDSVWIEPGNNKRAGQFRGAHAILEHGLRNQELTNGTLRTEVREILGGDAYVTVIERAVAERDGMALDVDCCTVYAIVQGVVAEMRVLPFDAAAWQDFWA